MIFGSQATDFSQWWLTYVRIDYVSNQLIHDVTTNIADKAIDPNRNRRKFNRLIKQINKSK